MAEKSIVTDFAERNLTAASSMSSDAVGVAAWMAGRVSSRVSRVSRVRSLFICSKNNYGVDVVQNASVAVERCVLGCACPGQPLVKIHVGHQHLARFTALGGADYTCAFELVHELSGTGIAYLEATLQERG